MPICNVASVTSPNDSNLATLPVEPQPCATAWAPPRAHGVGCPTRHFAQACVHALPPSLYTSGAGVPPRERAGVTQPKHNSRLLLWRPDPNTRNAAPYRQTTPTPCAVFLLPRAAGSTCNWPTLRQGAVVKEHGVRSPSGSDAEVEGCHVRGLLAPWHWPRYSYTAHWAHGPRPELCKLCVAAIALGSRQRRVAGDANQAISQQRRPARLRL